MSDAGTLTLLGAATVMSSAATRRVVRPPLGVAAGGLVAASSLLLGVALFGFANLRPLPWLGVVAAPGLLLGLMLGHVGRRQQQRGKALPGQETAGEG